MCCDLCCQISRMIKIPLSTCYNIMNVFLLDIKRMLNNHNLTTYTVMLIYEEHVPIILISSRCNPVQSGNLPPDGSLFLQINVHLFSWISLLHYQVPAAL